MWYEGDCREDLRLYTEDGDSVPTVCLQQDDEGAFWAAKPGGGWSRVTSADEWLRRDALEAGFNFGFLLCVQDPHVVDLLPAEALRACDMALIEDLVLGDHEAAWAAAQVLDEEAQGYHLLVEAALP